jgi:hypothetical protein
VRLGPLCFWPARLSSAARLYREIETPFDLAQVELEHGEWLSEQSRAEEAEPLLAEAEEIFTRLRARPWLERVQHARSRTLANA